MERLELSNPTDFVAVREDVKEFKKHHDRYYEFIAEAVAYCAQGKWNLYPERMN